MKYSLSELNDESENTGEGEGNRISVGQPCSWLSDLGWIQGVPSPFIL